MSWSNLREATHISDSAEAGKEAIPSMPHKPAREKILPRDLSVILVSESTMRLLRLLARRARTSVFEYSSILQQCCPYGQLEGRHAFAGTDEQAQVFGIATPYRQPVKEHSAAG